MSRAQGGIPFMVYKTRLQFLGLHSLKNINNGRPWIAYNQDLCYVNSVNWSSIVTSGNGATVQNNENETICGQFIVEFQYGNFVSLFELLTVVLV